MTKKILRMIYPILKVQIKLLIKEDILDEKLAKINESLKTLEKR